MPTVDILDQPTVVEATNDVAVVAFTEANVTVEVPSPAPVVEFASSASGLIVAGTGLTGGGALIGNVSLALSAASIASLAKAETAVQPGVGVSIFPNDAGYLTAATVEGGFQPLSDDLTYIANLTTTVFGRSFLELADAAAARTLLGVYGTADVYTKAEVGALITGFAAASHTHDNTDIVSVAWSKLTGIPTLFPPGAHTHLMADITDLTFTADHGGLTGLADDDHLQYHTDARGDARYSLLGHTHAYADAVHTHLWADITDKPLTFAPSSHTHLWVDITDKPLTFAPSSHTHLWADITDKPTTFTPAAHVHAAGDVTSGVFSTALLGTGTANSDTFLRGDGTWAGIPGGVTDHGALTGLANDDHTQYHTDARGDARYSLLGHTHPYLPLAGGTLTGDLVMGNQGNSALVATLMTSAEVAFGLRIYQGVTGVDTLVGEFGLAYNDQKNAMLQFYRGSAATGGSLRITANDNTEVARFTSSGLAVTGALTVGGTAVSLSGHAHSASDITTGTLSVDRLPKGGTSDWWNKAAWIAGDGVMEIGKYIDFHSTADGSDGSNDYAVRLTGNADNSLACSGNFTANNIYSAALFENGTTLSSKYSQTTHTHGTNRTSIQTANYWDSLTASTFRTVTFGSAVATGADLAIVRWNNVPAPLGLSAYGTAIAWACSDTQGFVAMNYNTAGVQVGGGNADNINWSDYLVLQNANQTLYGTKTFANHAIFQGGLSVNGSYIQGDGYNTWNANSFYTDGYGVMRFSQFSSTSTNTPVNVNNAQFMLWLGSHAGPYGKQIYFTDSDDLYMRRVSSGAWGAWHRLAAFPTTNGRYVKDTSGSYSSISVVGSNNTYAGIRLDSAFYPINFMWNTGAEYGGIYSETNSWLMYFNNGRVFIRSGLWQVPHCTWSSNDTLGATFSRGTAAPSGGTDGDVYFQYT